MVTLVSFPGILRDLLVIALENEGFERGSIFESLNEVKGIEGQECLIAYAENLDQQSVQEFKAFRIRFPDVPIEVISAGPVEPNIGRQMGHVVNAIIPADRPLDMVIRSLSIVAEGYSIIDRRSLMPRAPASAGITLKNERAQPSHEFEVADLSKRELTVLQKIGSGQSNKEIARELEISDFTVKAHVRSILIKTGTKNRTQAAIWASNNLRPGPRNGENRSSG